MSEFQLGQRVTFSHELYRLAGVERGSREWQHHPNDSVATTERDGIIVGRRTLANGIRRFETIGYDDSGNWEFDPKEFFPAYLVAYAMHRKPVLVRPEHIRPQAISLPSASDTPQQAGQPH